MHSNGRRKCSHCKEFFLPDPRNAHHQHYCAEPLCRRASKATSQRKWESHPENRDCYRGPERAAKVRAWQAAHPNYWKRRTKKTSVLPDVLIAQVAATQCEAIQDDGLVLPDVWRTQPPLVIGLIAKMTGFVLPEDIAAMAS